MHSGCSSTYDTMIRVQVCFMFHVYRWDIHTGTSKNDEVFQYFTQDHVQVPLYNVAFSAASMSYQYQVLVHVCTETLNHAQ